MQTWWNQSSYYWIGLYFGGVNVSPACDLPPDNAYVAAIHNQGWNIVPIWVGLQAPCASGDYGLEMSSNEQQAWDQGMAEANAAYNSFAFDWQLGAPPGILYLDIEAYEYNDNPNSVCAKAVINYMGGWTYQLQNLGLRSGIYAAPGSGIKQMYWYVANNYGLYSSE